MSDFTTKSISIAFAPLYWVLNEKRKAEDKPTLENFKKVFDEKKSENKKPGWLEKRLVSEFWGGLAALGSGALLGWNYFKQSKIWKYASWALGIGGVGSVFVGAIKYWRLKIGRIESKTFLSDLKSSLKSAVKKDSSNQGVEKEKVAEGNKAPDTRALVVVTNEERSQEEIKADNPSFFEQLRRLASGLKNKSDRMLIENIRLAEHPSIQILMTIFGGNTSTLFAEGLGAYARYIGGNFESVTEDGRKVKSLTETEKIKQYCKVLEVSENITEKELSETYRNKALQYHPDRQHDKNEEEKNAAIRKFKEAAEAFDYLKNHLPQFKKQ